MVLGAKLWDEKAKVVGMSVKSVGPEGVRMEETFTSVIKGFGRFPSGTNMGTVEATQSPDGGSIGSGQGICTFEDGDMAAWKFYFVGKVEEGKNKSFGIVKFYTASQKLAWLNKTVAALEAIADPKTMEGSDTGYEWK